MSFFLHFRNFVACLLCFVAFTTCYGQGLLQKKVNLEIKNKKLGEVLKTIGTQGGFYFSYNSNIIKKDSIVSLSVKGKTVQQVLKSLLDENCKYTETEKYVIIHTEEKEKWYVISGYITDGNTGNALADVSIFERNQLASAMTGVNGYFKLQLKDKGRFTTADITVSKGFYIDTNVSLIKGFDQELQLTITPQTYSLPDIVVTQYSHMEKTWLGRLLVSSKLRTQSLNLGKFFVDKPYQVSIIPGVGTHGKMSGQVANKFSMNVFGGYTAGVEGVEFGGLFNINKKDARYVQMGGIFNVVAGNSEGVQCAGISNYVAHSVTGVQCGGIMNKAGSVEGVQAAGFVNMAFDTVKGVQAGGFINVAKSANVQLAGFVNMAKEIDGAQVAGFINLAKEVRGIQMAGFINLAKTVDGVQVAGFINIADSSDYPIGLVNIVRNGDVSLGVTMEETGTSMIALRSGGRVLYGIVGLGSNINRTTTKNENLFAVQAGLGAHINITRHIRINTEVVSTTLSDLRNDRFHDNTFRVMPAVRLGRIELFGGAGINFANYTYKPKNIAFEGNTFWTGGNSVLHSEFRIGYIAGLQVRI